MCLCLGLVFARTKRISFDSMLFVQIVARSKGPTRGTRCSQGTIAFPLPKRGVGVSIGLLNLNPF